MDSKSKNDKDLNFKDYIKVRNSAVCADIPRRYYISNWLWACFYSFLISIVGIGYIYMEITLNGNERFCTFEQMGGFERFFEIYYEFENDNFSFKLPVIVFLVSTGMLFLFSVLRFGFSVKIDWAGFYKQNRKITYVDRLAMQKYRGIHFLNYFTPILFFGQLFWVVFYDSVIMIMDANNEFHFTYLEYMNYKWPWTLYLINFSHFVLVRYWTPEQRYEFVSIVLDKLQHSSFSEFKKLHMDGLNWKWRTLKDIDYTKIDMNWSSEYKLELANKYENIRDLVEAVFSRVEILWLESLPKVEEVVKIIPHNYWKDIMYGVIFYGACFTLFYTLAYVIPPYYFAKICNWTHEVEVFTPQEMAQLSGQLSQGAINAIVSTAVQQAGGITEAGLLYTAENVASTVLPQLNGLSYLGAGVYFGMKALHYLLRDHIDLSNNTDVLVASGAEFLMSFGVTYAVAEVLKYPLIMLGVVLPFPSVIAKSGFFILSGFLYGADFYRNYHGGDRATPQLLADLDLFDGVGVQAVLLDAALVVLFDMYNIFLC